MTTKEYFEQALTLNKRINSKLDHLGALREMTTKASITLSDMPRSSSRNMYQMQDIISKIVDLENEINGDIDRFVDMKREYMRIIREIRNPVFQLVMEQRYLCCRTWEKISEELGYEL
ncbi:MAG: hypothetical protein PHI67_06875, partial [Candidatus Methanomethylophilaceae archaeon]|nr:hypothetical protein [Candidatus Methanomethylophilaceae archaeon]